MLAWLKLQQDRNVSMADGAAKIQATSVTVGIVRQRRVYIDTSDVLPKNSTDF